MRNLDFALTSFSIERYALDIIDSLRKSAEESGRWKFVERRLGALEEDLGKALSAQPSNILGFILVPPRFLASATHQTVPRSENGRRNCLLENRDLPLGRKLSTGNRGTLGRGRAGIVDLIDTLDSFAQP